MVCWSGLVCLLWSALSCLPSLPACPVFLAWLACLPLCPSVSVFVPAGSFFSVKQFSKTLLFYRQTNLKKFGLLVWSGLVCLLWSALSRLPSLSACPACLAWPACLSASLSACVCVCVCLCKFFCFSQTNFQGTINLKTT